MRSDNLKKHMKKHERGNDDNIITKGLDDVGTDDNIVTKELDDEKTQNNVKTEMVQKSCTSENFMGLEKEVLADWKEFNRKIELGREVNKIVNKHGVNDASLSINNKEALKTYKLYGKNMDMKDIEWRGWQKDLRQYLDKECDRKIIWIVGKEGNEGKSFFQANIRDEFGPSRVCKLPLSENSRNTFHIMGKICSNKTDIFLFNVARAVRLGLQQYKILERIKDGKAVYGKYNSQKLKFKKPNVLMVFSTREPDQNKLSMDRWVILKISNDLTELTDIEGRKLEKSKEKIKHFCTRDMEPERKNIDSDASRKRKSSEMGVNVE